MVRFLFYILNSSGDFSKDLKSEYITLKRADECCQIPKLITRVGPGRISIGTVTYGADPDSGTFDGICCGNICYDIFNVQNELKYKVTGNPCQPAVCLGYVGKKMGVLHFDIRKGRENVGEIEKLSSSWSEYLDDANSYKIKFPPDATPEEKLLCVASVMIIEYGYKAPR